MFDRNAWRAILSQPRGALLLTLVAGSLIALLPRRAVAPLGHAFERVLAPGVVVAATWRNRGASLIERFERDAASAEQLATLTSELHRLRDRNRELETALAISAAGDKENAAATAGSPLVIATGLRARVLGRRTCAALPKGAVIDLGATSGVVPDALALVDSQVAVDQGTDRGVAVGDLALYGSLVYGKVIGVGPHSAVVRPVDQPGFRDVVRIAHLTEDGRLEFGPRGLWEGTGERRCRVRHVPAAEVVAPGDLVFSVGEEGFAPQPLAYGKIVSAECRAGAPHWDIEVEPASSDAAPRHLVVLRAELNPERVARAAVETTTNKPE